MRVFKKSTGYVCALGLALILTVTARAAAPIWEQNPIVFSTESDTAFTADLSSMVSPDNGRITFSLVAGPSWLTLSASGVMSGTPALADVGQDNFVVRAQNESGEVDDANVAISVARD